MKRINYERIAYLANAPVELVTVLINDDWHEGSIYDENSRHYKWINKSNDHEIAEWIRDLIKAGDLIDGYDKEDYNNYINTEWEIKPY